MRRTFNMGIRMVLVVSRVCGQNYWRHPWSKAYLWHWRCDPWWGGTVRLTLYALTAWLIAGYCKCELVQNARELFDKMMAKNLMAWTAMINGNAQTGRPKAALAWNFTCLFSLACPIALHSFVISLEWIVLVALSRGPHCCYLAKMCFSSSSFSGVIFWCMIYGSGYWMNICWCSAS